MNILYTDIGEFQCAYIRALADAGHLPEGDILEADINDIGEKYGELGEYDQAHFFCGLGGWPLALRIAGMGSAGSVWTASLPCPSFSCAGKQRGFDDPRGKLLEPFLELVAGGMPRRIYGEQVWSKDTVGNASGREAKRKASDPPVGKVVRDYGYVWLDRVFDGLEKLGYACGAAVLPACCCGAPHRRYRIFWGAALDDSIGEDQRGRAGRCGERDVEGPSRRDSVSDGASASRATMGQPVGERLEGHSWDGGGEGGRKIQGGPTREASPPADPWESAGIVCRDIDKRTGKPAIRRVPSEAAQPRILPLADDGEGTGAGVAGGGVCGCGFSPWPTPTANPDTQSFRSGDETHRPLLKALAMSVGDIPPGTCMELFPLAEKRKGRKYVLEAAGNAIVPQVAATFLRAFEAALEEEA